MEIKMRSVADDLNDYDKRERKLLSRLKKIKKAGTAIYKAGHWTCDRPIEGGAEKLWETFRDAMGLKPGNASRPVKKGSSIYDSDFNTFMAAVREAKECEPEKRSKVQKELLQNLKEGLGRSI